MAQIVHATAVALGDRAALIRGPSGSGKSDLALRFMALRCWPLAGPGESSLIADDQVSISVVDGVILASAPPAIQGLLEVRGIGLVSVPFRSPVAIRLVVDLVDPGAVPRMPDPPGRVGLLGIQVPSMLLAPFEASASLKLALALAAVPTCG